MTGSNTISIVIPTYNRWSLLQRTLHDVDAMTVPDGMRCEVIVVANACSDGTAEAVAATARETITAVH
jgi:glycosyltransferase involved in cell wall biosynthesis